MDAFRKAKSLAAEGRFGDALRTLETGTVRAPDKISADVFRAEMMQQVGKTVAAESLITNILRSKHLSSCDHSLCFFVLGRIATGDGRLDLACEHLQKAASISSSAGDYERAAWAQSRLLLILADSATPDAAGPLL